MQFPVCGDPFDGSHLATVSLYSKERTRFYRPAIQQHCARTTVGGIAPNVRSSEHNNVPDEMDQQQTRLDLRLALSTIHLDPNMFFRGHKGLFCGDSNSD
jgi:hypothetical protein